MPARESGEEFSSAKLRERDQNILKTHQSELKELQQKLDKAKKDRDGVWTRFFDLKNVAERVAISLGFLDLFEVQGFIDENDGDNTTYRECLERYKLLEKEKEGLVQQSQTMSERLKALEEANDRLTAENESLKSQLSEDRKNSSQFTVLKKRYDELVAEKTRDDKFQNDVWVKWQKFKDWIFDVGECKPGQTEEEISRQIYLTVRRKWQKTIKVGRGGEPADFWKVAEQDIKENVSPAPKKHTTLSTTPVSSRSHKPSTSTTHSPLNPSVKVNQDLPDSTGLEPKVKAEPKPHIPGDDDDVFSKTPASGLRRSYAFATTAINSPAVAEATTSVPPSGSPAPDGSEDHVMGPPQRPSSPASSETEVDSQPLHISPRRPPSTAPAPSRRNPLLFRKVSASGSPTSSRRKSGTSITSSQSSGNDEHVRKYRRVSEGNNASTRRSPVKPPVVDYGLIDLTGGSSSPPDVTPVSSSRLSGPTTRTRDDKTKSKSRDKENDDGSREQMPKGKGKDTVIDYDMATTKGKGKEREREEEMLFATPTTGTGKGKERQRDERPKATPATGNKNSVDYSAYKGRGRYGQGNAKGKDQEKTLNEVYAINPDRNEGLSHQFDQVVRGKEKRKRLDAGDCEECRQYYEAIGPMPPRLQPPLWRSPTRSPSARTHIEFDDTFGSQLPNVASTSRAHTSPTSHAAARRREKEKQSHRQAISRHRDEWKKGATPPGYWDIGFPDTQKAEEINQRADEMHRHKMEEAAREAQKKDGKYVKRK
ncbi:hypothetical protein K435DRAFT_751322 [Dendrothele bispora CBS 962.96]|uniref:DNA endonuclease activator Ctp1 C-terminal domain-containing protein n=1 Tax=Dendrothele bispora (strain CBS 962.96) TaxID=1314807 RepID=A0A4S8MCU2_DENBC|nr:hypothetical protein K435DRAFT_751322 [Dendrothele bispora CBS 962.96]